MFKKKKYRYLVSYYMVVRTPGGGAKATEATGVCDTFYVTDRKITRQSHIERMKAAVVTRNTPAKGSCSVALINWVQVKG